MRGGAARVVVVVGVPTEFGEACSLLGVLGVGAGDGVGRAVVGGLGLVAAG